MQVLIMIIFRDVRGLSKIPQTGSLFNFIPIRVIYLVHVVCTSCTTKEKKTRENLIWFTLSWFSLF